MSHADELEARYNVFMDRYVKLRMIELEVASELLKTHVLPAATNHQASMASSLQSVEKVLGTYPAAQKAQLEKFSTLTDTLVNGIEALDAVIAKAHTLGEGKDAGTFIATEGLGALNTVRTASDAIESQVDDSLWTLPKYREILFNY